ncbi:hypothetical protein MCUN1_002293 [Malassezia cuniculi]|uniref:Class E vacuolar protein-sorting machinery protein HSE1 n=1 Tax=Malassezia cuniculi TaxID=948313 RepID=A0AAF0EUM7_9BASI|nr:hypothetical protein MCUN1_002293 [Malassezia cuniculi]
MFRAQNPFDDVVAKATDEHLTSENWQLNMQVCDMVVAGDDATARQCISAIQKRLLHRSANVQLYALTLTDSLSTNCDKIHAEIASRAFMQTITRLVTNRHTHHIVKQRALKLLREWANAYKSDDTLGLVQETMHELKGEYYEIDDEPVKPAAKQADDDEELKRVLEISRKEQEAAERAAAAAAAATSNVSAPTMSTAAPVPATPASDIKSAQPPQQAYAPPQQQQQTYAPPPQQTNVFPTHAHTQPQQPAPQQYAPQQYAPPQPRQPTYVRAHYDFVPTERGELAFSRGDVIRVLASVYEHWWRGELRGMVGIFPVNYVEPLPDITPEQVEQEIAMENTVLAQAGDIDRLLVRLRQIDPTRDNVTDDDELQELYQKTLHMRPQLIRLIERRGPSSTG